MGSNQTKKTKKRRYSLKLLLQNKKRIKQLNKRTKWAREGNPVGREIV